MTYRKIDALVAERVMGLKDVGFRPDPVGAAIAERLRGMKAIA